MFKLDDVLERWAIIYEPMQHNPSLAAKPEDLAFFRIDRLELENAFTRTFNLLKKPCLCQAINFDSQLDEKRPRLALYHHQLYFCQKQYGGPNYMQEEKAAADTKYDINEMVLDLIGFLFALQDAAEGKSFPKDTPQSVRDLFTNLSDEERRGIKGLQMNQTEWWSVPRFKNGWWIMGVELWSLDTTQLCIRPTRYIPAYPTIASEPSTAESSAPTRRGRKS